MFAAVMAGVLSLGVPAASSCGDGGGRERMVLDVRLTEESLEYNAPLRPAEPGTFVLWLEGAHALERCELTVVWPDAEEVPVVGGARLPTPFGRLEWDGERELAVRVRGSRKAELRLVVQETGSEPDAIAFAERMRGEARDVEERTARGEPIEPARLSELLAALRACADPTSEDTLLAAEDLGFAALEAGDVATAVAALEIERTALERLRPSDHDDAQRGASNLALATLYAGRYSESAERFGDLLAVRTRLLEPDDPLLVSARANLGAALASCGRQDEAIPHLEYVLERRRDVLDPGDPALLRPTVNLAHARLAVGDPAGARPLLEQVLELTRDGVGPIAVERGRALTVLAGVWRQAGDLLGARVDGERAVETLEEVLLPDHPFVSSARSELAMTLRRQGHGEESERRLLDIVEQARRTSGDSSEAARNGQFNLAIARLERGHAAEALEELDALADLEELDLAPHHPSRLATDIARAEALRTLGRRDESRELYERTLAGYDDIGVRGADRLGFVDNLLALAIEQGDGELVRHDLGLLLDALRDSFREVALLSGREARAVLDDARAPLSLAFFAAVEFDPPAIGRVFEVCALGRAVAAGTAILSAPPAADRELDELVRDVSATRAELSALLGGGRTTASDGGDLPEAVAALAARRDAAERRLARAAAERGLLREAPSLAQLADGLDEGDALVQFAQLADVVIDSPKCRPGPDRLFSFVLTRTGEPELVDLGPVAAIEETVEGWRNSLGTGALRGLATHPDGDRESELGNRAFEALLAPVLTAAGSGVVRLFVVADGPAHVVPLDALPLEEGGCVGDRIAIVLEPAPASRQPASPSGVRGPLLVVGAVDYGADGGPSAASEPRTASVTKLVTPFAGLLQSRFEVETVRAIFQGCSKPEDEVRVLVGGQATKAALVEAVRGARFVHLATHGWFTPESVLSERDFSASVLAGLDAGALVAGFAPESLCGLALTGANRGRDALGRLPGLLSAEELATFDLGACELAVLSACETNVGIRRAGQGIQSLQTALHAAGARTAITSLWKVDDAATRRLFELFYAKLWQEGLGKADALWQAKMALRAEGHPPRDWAGWVLSGDPR